MAGSPPGPTMGAKPLVGAGQGFHRPILVAIIAVLIILGGVVLLLIGIAILLLGGFLGFAIAGPVGAALGAIFGIVVMVFGGILLAAGLGLWRLKGWAWWLAAIVMLLSLAGSVYNGGYFGASVGGLIFVYLLVVKKHFNQ